ncbi:alpha/beta-hydrolase [Phlegmacium glaucopus]|nr:alpha/beta-hydrolase [Phlegmacium glaucopus]
MYWLFTTTAPIRQLSQLSQRSPAQSLLHYQSNVPPPSARVDPKLLRLQPRRPLRLWDYWKFGAFVASKATEVTSDVLSHHIWGPRRQSWGIEMTIVSSLIRGAERHSALVDIASFPSSYKKSSSLLSSFKSQETIRMLMSIGGLVPLPSDALVTPVTFRVSKRHLPGILADLDAMENGQRELCGEWVVGRKTWQRMQTEWKAANKSNPTSPQLNSNISSWDTSSDSAKVDSKRKERVVLYIHGGAYYLSSAAAQRIISIPLAKHTDSRVFAIDYRLAPETCFPGPLHDVVCAYLRLVEDLHIPPENIIICGDSAGGGLSLALLMYLRDNGYTLPSGAILISPWVDLTMSCESWDSNAPYDVVPFPTADNHMNPIALYLGENIEMYLTHPYASPLFGDFKDLPPLLIQAGDAEVLRDEIILLAHKATLAGVQVRHELYEDAIHVFQAYPFLDASRRSFESMRNFVREMLPQCQSRSPQMLGVIAERGLEREIENEHAVVVGGDGVEALAPNDKQARKNEFGLSSKHGEELEKRGGVTGKVCSSSDEDSDDISSWVKSPGWPTLSLGVGSRKESTKSKHGIEHIEDIDIPPLSLLPPPLHSLSMPSTRTSSSTTMKSTPKMSVPPPPAPLSLPSISSPRRIKSTTSLSTFALQLKNQTVPESHPHDVRPRYHHRKHSASSYNFSTNPFTLHHSIPRPTSFKGPPRNLVMSTIQP